MDLTRGRIMGKGFSRRISGKLSPQAGMLALTVCLTMGAAALALTALVAPGTGETVPPALGDPWAPGEVVDTVEAAEDEQAEIVAAGGASISGHAVTAEVCDAVDAIIATGGGGGAVWPASAELMDATQRLAAAESPNREQYGAYALLLETTEDGSLDQAGFETVYAYNQALRADIATCS